MNPTPADGRGLPVAFWLVMLAAGGTFALTMGARQSMGLFLGPINTATGLGFTRAAASLLALPAAWVLRGRGAPLATAAAPVAATVAEAPVTGAVAEAPVTGAVAEAPVTRAVAEAPVGTRAAIARAWRDRSFRLLWPSVR